jgi:hypothetical protein
MEKMLKDDAASGENANNNDRPSSRAARNDDNNNNVALADVLVSGSFGDDSHHTEVTPMMRFDN